MLHGKSEMFAVKPCIDPEECIDCGACVEACPVDTIFPEDQVPDQWQRFIAVNADYYRRT